MTRPPNEHLTHQRTRYLIRNRVKNGALDSTNHATHKEQASMIRRYIIWRNNHAYDERLRRIINRANVA